MSTEHTGQENLSEYQQLRANLHEIRCRLTATIGFVRQGFCHRRSCRRNRCCVGPMLTSPHQDAVVKLQRELGLSGRANACLPACIAFQSAEFAALFTRTMSEVGELQETTPDIQILRMFQEGMKDHSQIDIYAHLTSFADHPTSVQMQTGMKKAPKEALKEE